ncbi:hypothetical protein SAMN05444156_3249 [Verrucomicrobium sp. GAS474]|uniref:hypothetical protein n=1 Tax=Verrucomicrobium sp. GAS474 TaxID=1882831 RepID=UPI00087D15EA|nr:hypothetical protein [Verrucomicrobium sp. GAS474]SDT85656.1 hypothetical protein SAMN05444156_0011 [Verrucomicrobium sp. GAS474]SDU31575.1 hypothetical protein SAMN05444156_3249 [Verrucomicrobium sp. GAS474]
MKHIQGDLLAIERGILVHQVNCIGAMGGLAGQVREKWPLLGREYRGLCAADKLRPGMVTFFRAAPELIIANLAGQLGVGRAATDYDAYEVALPAIKSMSAVTGLPIFFPHKIGCGLGGGDWDRMFLILKNHCPDATLVEFLPDLEEIEA